MTTKGNCWQGIRYKNPIPMRWRHSCSSSMPAAWRSLAVLGVLGWPRAALCSAGMKNLSCPGKRVRAYSLPGVTLYYLTDTSVVIVAYAHTRHQAATGSTRLDR